MTDAHINNPLRKPTPPWHAERQFGLIVPIGLALVGAVLRWHWQVPTAATVLWVIAGVFLVLRFTVPMLLWPFNKFWMGFAAVLGFVNTRIILGVVFYVIVTPIGRIRCWFGGDPLDRRIQRERTSYWKPREHEPVPQERWERQF